MAFAGSVNEFLTLYKTSYFSYIVLGEILLSLPLYYIDAPLRQVKYCMHTGVFQTFMSLPISKLRACFLMSHFGILRVLLRVVLTFIIASLFFGLKIPTAAFFSILIYIVTILPFCFGLGLIILTIFLITGRGQAALGYISTMIAFFSGALFPISVLPQWLTNYVLPYFPITRYLDGLRLLIAGGKMKISDPALFLLWGSVLMVSILMLKAAFSYRRKNGSLVISQY